MVLCLDKFVVELVGGGVMEHKVLGFELYVLKMARLVKACSSGLVEDAWDVIGLVLARISVHPKIN